MFYVQLITNILKQLIFNLSDFPHLLLNMSLKCTLINLTKSIGVLIFLRVFLGARGTGS